MKRSTETNTSTGHILRILRKMLYAIRWPCHYFHQMNIALAASHSVLNYAIFLGLLNKNLPARELLVLDESHLLETEIVRFRGIVISRKKWRKYIPELKIDNHGYDINGWLEFITDLEEEMLDIRIPPQNQEIMIEASQDLRKTRNDHRRHLYKF